MREESSSAGHLIPIVTPFISNLRHRPTVMLGLAFPPKGGMEGADIFIAGVHGSNGSKYHGDYFAPGVGPPKLDDVQNWELVGASEEGGTTTIEFKRASYTCDDAEDYPIEFGTTRVIWALGQTDDIQYHSSNRGTRSLTLIGEPVPELNMTGLEFHEMSLEVEMPDADTSYWCSFHKGPVLIEKHHVVALNAFLPDSDALKHTHHFILSQCTLPPGSNQTLEQVYGNFTVENGFGGGHCHEQGEVALPLEHCVLNLFVWAKGGKMMVFPDNVGYPIGETEQVSYYKLETHYDNPEKVQGLKFRTGVTIYHTDELREQEASTLVLGQITNFRLTIPPNQKEFTLAAYCTSNCTNWGLETRDGGINVFNVGLHSHLSGRKMKVRHFRGDRELPWLDFDDRYDFDYQQNRPIQPLQVLSGDDLIVECTYDSAWNGGKVVVGGYSTRNEMCMAYLFYYPRDELVQCLSQVKFEDHMSTFGITSFHMENVGSLGPHMYIDEPEYLRGLYTEGMNNFTWSDEFVQAYQVTRRYGDQEQVCVKHSGEYMERIASFPAKASEYVPERKDCSPKEGSASTLSSSVSFLLVGMSFAVHL